MVSKFCSKAKRSRFHMERGLDAQVRYEHVRRWRSEMLSLPQYGLAREPSTILEPCVLLDWNYLIILSYVFMMLINNS